MSGNLSKQTMRLVQNAQTIVSAAEIHGPAAAARLAQRYGQGHAAFEVAALSQTVDGHRWLLTTTAATLVAAEEALGEELGDNRGLREALGEAVAQTRTLLVQARELSSGLFTSAEVSAMGFVGETPEDVTSLLSFAGGVSKGLRGQQGKKGRLGLTLDMEPLAAEIDRAADAVRVSQEAYQADGREDEAARAKRDAAFDALRLVCRCAGLTLEGMLRLSEMSALADRLRPNERRAQDLEDAPALEDGAGA